MARPPRDGPAPGNEAARLFTQLSVSGASAPKTRPHLSAFSLNRGSALPGVQVVTANPGNTNLLEAQEIVALAGGDVLTTYSAEDSGNTTTGVRYGEFVTL